MLLRDRVTESGPNFQSQPRGRKEPPKTPNFDNQRKKVKQAYLSGHSRWRQFGQVEAEDEPYLPFPGFSKKLRSEENREQSCFLRCESSKGADEPLQRTRGDAYPFRDLS